jgi:hypothetical protein
MKRIEASFPSLPALPSLFQSFLLSSKALSHPLHPPGRLIARQSHPEFFLIAFNALLDDVRPSHAPSQAQLAAGMELLLRENGGLCRGTSVDVLHPSPLLARRGASDSAVVGSPSLFRSSHRTSDLLYWLQGPLQRRPTASLLSPSSPSSFNFPSLVLLFPRSPSSLVSFFPPSHELPSSEPSRRIRRSLQRPSLSRTARRVLLLRPSVSLLRRWRTSSSTRRSSSALRPPRQPLVVRQQHLLAQPGRRGRREMARRRLVPWRRRQQDSPQAGFRTAHGGGSVRPGPAAVRFRSLLR